MNDVWFVIDLVEIEPRSASVRMRISPHDKNELAYLRDFNCPAFALFKVAWFHTGNYTPCFGQMGLKHTAPRDFSLALLVVSLYRSQNREAPYLSDTSCITPHTASHAP